MKMKNIFISANASLILFALAACNVPKAIPTPMPEPTAVVVPATGMEYFFVTNKLQIPTTQEQTQAFAVNVDEDTNKTLDNKFGDLFTLITSTVQGIELQSTLDQSVDAGQLVSLHMVKTDNVLNDTNVSWTISPGQKNPSAPKFDGTDRFSIDSAAPLNMPLIGSITNGHFKGGPGAVKVQFVLLGQLVEMDLLGVHLEADLSEQGCRNGKLGGGISSNEFRSKLLPAIADGLNQIIKVDKTMANTLLLTFDSDKNGTITVKEIETNPLVMIILSPDMDLLDASGKFIPNQDGVKDSYSLGFGFTCVPAVITK